MKKLKNILCSGALLLAMLPHSAEAASFTDVGEGAWYKWAVDYVSEQGLISGVTDTAFEPDTQMSRGEFVSVLGKMEQINTANYTGSAFPDVAESNAYHPYIIWAADSGIVSGYANGDFGLHDPITREQMALMIGKYLSHSDNLLPPYQNVTPFEDASTIGSWALPSAETMKQIGIMTGDAKGRFNPQQNITRAETSAMIARLSMELDSIEKLTGVYEGTYGANQGETAMHVTIYRSDDKYVTTYDFYNIDGKNNAEEGIFVQDVYRTETGYDLIGREWLNKPSTYSMVHLEVKSGDMSTISGAVSSSGSMTSRTYFATKVGEETPNFQDLIGTWTGTYSQGSDSRNLILTVKNGDTVTANFAFNDANTGGSVEGDYEMDVYPIRDGYYFNATEWNNQPNNYGTLDLSAVIDGNTLSGEKDLPFSLTK